MDKPSTIGSAAEIMLLCASAQGGCRYSDLKAQLGDPAPATLSRRLKMLVEACLLQVDAETGRYRTGEKLETIARAVMGMGHREELIAEELRSLAIRTRQSALYVEQSPADPTQMIFVYKHDVSEGIHHHEAGTQMFLLQQGFGLGILCQQAKDQQERVLHLHVQSTGEARGPVTADLASLQREGVLARAERFASSPLGVTRVIAPVYSTGLPATIGITAFGRLGHGLDREVISAWKHKVAISSGKLSVPGARR